MSKERYAVFYKWFALVAAACFALLTFGYTTEKSIMKDGAQNTRAAYHLVHTGVMSLDKLEVESPRPQMLREPLPIVVTAAFMLLHPAFNTPYTIAELTEGRLTETVKGVSAFWRFLAAIFVFLLCMELFPDRRVAAAMAVLCLIVSENIFFAAPGIVDRMYTELPEVALMLLAAWFTVRFTRSKTNWRAVLVGLALGALALTKVSFLYIGIGFIFLLFAMEGLRLLRSAPKDRSWSSFFSLYAVIALAMFGTVAPWIGRNSIEFANPQIASGTDTSVLGIRMLLTEQPLLGGLYMFSPSGVRKLVIGPLTGYTDKDLNQGGRLEQLAAVKEKKWDVLKQRMAAEGHQADPGKWARHAALDAAIQSPLRYIASVGVFAYKGMWFLREGGVFFNVVALGCFFAVFFGAIFTGNQLLVAAFGLPAGLFFFVSIFTHALTRYNVAMTPFVIIAVLWLLTTLVRKVWRSRVIQRRKRIPRMAHTSDHSDGAVLEINRGHWHRNESA
jgi:hypothetical protein